MTMETLAGESLATLRLMMWLMVGFGASALLLASLGIYGVLAQAVARRRREIGIRMAIGQTPDAVLGSVMKQGGRLIVAALLIGVPAAGLTGYASRSLLFGVEPIDPTTFIVTGLLLTLVALLACWIPAHRATRVDPAVALRE